MTASLRKLTLTAHVAVSVGWLGAVAGFLVLSIAGLTSTDADEMRGIYFAMERIGRYAIVPMSFGALATGLFQALTTDWGLWRHYWVLVKFLLTLFATVALLLHQFTAVKGAARLASQADSRSLPGTELRALGLQLVADAAVALLVLLVVTTLSVYKPWGRTRYGRRKQQEARDLFAASAHEPREQPVSVSDKEATKAASRFGLNVVLAVIGAIVVAFVVLHLAGGGLGHHTH